MEASPVVPITRVSPVESAARVFAQSLMDREASKQGVTIDTEGNPGAVESWVAHVADKLVTMTGVIEFPEIPAIARERITIETIFGLYVPSQISEGELEDALSTLVQADEELPLDEDEQELRRELSELLEAVTDGTSPAIRDSEVDSYLNEQIPHDLPEWINEGIEWESLYMRVERDYGKRVELSFDSFIVFDGIY
jgi:hypothetical protein